MVEESGDGKLKLEDCNVAMEMQKKNLQNIDNWKECHSGGKNVRVIKKKRNLNVHNVFWTLLSEANHIFGMWEQSVYNSNCVA